MAPTDPQYTDAERALLERMRSRVSVARTVLSERLSQGWTQEELGKAAGTKQSRVSELEAMKGNPRFDTLDRIASVLGLMISLVPKDTRSFVNQHFETELRLVSQTAYGSSNDALYRGMILRPQGHGHG